jgi:hypothetical protein
MPFENSLNLRVAEKHDDGVTVEFDLLPQYLNSQGSLHGGVTASLARGTRSKTTSATARASRPLRS